MKKLLLVILGPFFFVACIAIGLVWWFRGAPPGFRPTPVERTPDQVSLDDRGVKVVGTAHYPVHLKQTSKDQETTWYLFPLFNKGDTMGRRIHVMVRTTHRPDPILGFEDMTVEGLARPPGMLVPSAAREALEQKGYTFDPDFVLIEEWDDIPGEGPGGE